jgi:hypothetical protein
MVVKSGSKNADNQNNVDKPVDISGTKTGNI